MATSTFLLVRSARSSFYTQLECYTFWTSCGHMCLPFSPPAHAFILITHTHHGFNLPTACPRSSIFAKSLSRAFNDTAKQHRNNFLGVLNPPSIGPRRSCQQRWHVLELFVTLLRNRGKKSLKQKKGYYFRIAPP